MQSDRRTLTSFGAYVLKLFRLWTDDVTGDASGEGLKGLLQEIRMRLP